MLVQAPDGIPYHFTCVHTKNPIQHTLQARRLPGALHRRLAWCSCRPRGPPLAGVCVSYTWNARGRGMHCRLGASVARRPVAHAVCRNVALMRTSSPCVLLSDGLSSTVLVCAGTSAQAVSGSQAAKPHTWVSYAQADARTQDARAMRLLLNGTCQGVHASMSDADDFISAWASLTPSAGAPGSRAWRTRSRWCTAQCWS